MLRSGLKKVIPRSVIDFVKSALEKIDISISGIASIFRWSSALYYFILSVEFRREMQSVLIARKRYYRSKSGQDPTSFMLRRNVHRLEKGLIMQPRRRVFGEGYIVETLVFWQLCIDADSLSDTESSWVNAVIAEYFSAVEFTRTIEKAWQAYLSITENLVDREYNTQHIPQSYSSLPSNCVDFDAFKALCERRHSVRWFKKKPVPKKLIDAAVSVATTAPSACNRQPFKFYVFDEPERAQSIGAIPMGTAGFSHNFQAIVVVVGDLSAYPFEKDRHIIYIDSALAVMQFQLALETQGLGSCVINWPDIERHERQMALELNIKPYERPVMLVAVGYPLAEGKVPYSAKKTVSELVVRPK